MNEWFVCSVCGLKTQETAHLVPTGVKWPRTKLVCSGCFLLYTHENMTLGSVEEAFLYHAQVQKVPILGQDSAEQGRTQTTEEEIFALLTWMRGKRVFVSYPVPQSKAHRMAEASNGRLTVAHEQEDWTVLRLEEG